MKLTVGARVLAISATSFASALKPPTVALLELMVAGVGVDGAASSVFFSCSEEA